MSAAKQCDEVEGHCRQAQYQGLIDLEEKNALILEATERYAGAVAGGQGMFAFHRHRKARRGGLAPGAEKGRGRPAP